MMYLSFICIISNLDKEEYVVKLVLLKNRIENNSSNYEIEISYAQHLYFLIIIFKVINCVTLTFSILWKRHLYQGNYLTFKSTLFSNKHCMTVNQSDYKHFE